MRKTASNDAPKMRELFIEELTNIQGGSTGGGGGNTTMACCEEGPFGCCDHGINLDEIIGP